MRCTGCRRLEKSRQDFGWRAVSAATASIRQRWRVNSLQMRWSMGMTVGNFSCRMRSCGAAARWAVPLFKWPTGRAGEGTNGRQSARSSARSNVASCRRWSDRAGRRLRFPLRTRRSCSPAQNSRAHQCLAALVDAEDASGRTVNRPATCRQCERKLSLLHRKASAINHHRRRELPEHCGSEAQPRHTRTAR